MKRVAIAALVAAQLGPCAMPAQAASLTVGAQQQETRMAAFAGAHVKMALGGEKQRVRAGLTVAPALHGTKDGVTSLRIGEGLQYGFTDSRRASFSLAGQRIGSEGKVPGGPRQGVSTLGWVGIGAGVVLLAGAAFLGWLVHEANQNTE